VDRAQQHGVDLRGAAYRRFVRIARALQGGKHRNLVHQDAGRLAQRFSTRNHAVGLDVQHQLVRVGTLFDTGAFHGIAHATYGAVRSVQDDTANGMGAVLGQRTHVARHIAAAFLDLDLHFNLAGFGQVADDVVGIDDLDVVRQLDVAGHDRAGAILAQHQGYFVAIVQLEDHALQVQQDVDDIFTHTRNGRVF